MKNANFSQKNGKFFFLLITQREKLLKRIKDFTEAQVANKIKK